MDIQFHDIATVFCEGEFQLFDRYEDIVDVDTGTLISGVGFSYYDCDFLFRVNSFMYFLKSGIVWLRYLPVWS